MKQNAKQYFSLFQLVTIAGRVLNKFWLNRLKMWINQPATTYCTSLILYNLNTPNCNLYHLFWSAVGSHWQHWAWTLITSVKV